MRTLINIGISENQDRKITIQYADKKFYVLHESLKQDIEPFITEYTFDGFIGTLNLMKTFMEEICLNDKDAFKQLVEVKQKQFNTKTLVKYV